ncbi:MAG TPA: hypothetical protein VK183_12760 [Flavobacterium sp.]|nr:hypothetical protein [Flavobacterium sp.]
MPLIFILLGVVAFLLPFLGYVEDGKALRQPQRAWRQMLAFVVCGVVSVVLLKLFGLYFALGAPLATVVVLALRSTYKGHRQPQKNPEQRPGHNF